MDFFNIEDNYQFYLQKVGLSDAIMHPTQASETKRAFMAGMAQMFHVFSTNFWINADPNALQKLEKMHENLQEFWESQE